MADVLYVGVIGFGVVGSGAVKILVENAENIAQKVGARIEVKRIADLDIKTSRPVNIDPSILTTSANDVLDDPQIQIIVETIGGVNPAGDFIKKALKSGKCVVTANKELMAKQGYELLSIAAENNVEIMYEASVGGGIPIIRPLKTCLAANNISEIKGIVNGTTNYILTKMSQDGLEFADALKEAQAKGYAEADPSADVEGRDAAYKIAILASIAFNSKIDVNKVSCEGISKISKADIAYADELGFVIKLLAVARQAGDSILVRVHPAFVPKDHPLASVNGVFNGIFVKGDAVGDVMFYGPGAGSMAAGSAVAADVIDIARNILSNCCGRVHNVPMHEKQMLGQDSVSCMNYIRVVAQDKPRVLASIAAEFANCDVSIAEVMQKAADDSLAEIVLLTHLAPERAVASALESIGNLQVVKEIGAWIRVEK